MKFCEICKKEESKWSEGFIFAYHINGDKDNGKI